MAVAVSVAATSDSDNRGGNLWYVPSQLSSCKNRLLQIAAGSPAGHIRRWRQQRRKGTLHSMHSPRKQTANHGSHCRSAPLTHPKNPVLTPPSLFLMRPCEGEFPSISPYTYRHGQYGRWQMSTFVDLLCPVLRAIGGWDMDTRQRDD